MLNLPAGKVVVVAPETAVRLFDAAPQHSERIYTVRGIAPNIAYVFDADEIEESFEKTLREMFDVS